MRIIRDMSAYPEALRGAVLALGNFDGVHRGHKAILDTCVDKALELKRPAAVMTFCPHPREFFAPMQPALRLSSLAEKLSALRASGIAAVFLARFNAGFAAMGAESFVRDLLHRQLAARHIVTGYNFAFGKGRSGDTEFLAALASQLGMGYTACPAVMDAGGEVVSSSRIRHALAAGDVKGAAALLGRPYVIEGRVRGGDKRGRAMGFPTANLPLTQLFVPRLGVYAARIMWGEEAAPAVVNIGIRPTFGGTTPVLEAHALREVPALYGLRLRVALQAFIRDERRFDSADALKAQIGEDCRAAAMVLSLPQEVR